MYQQIKDKKPEIGQLCLFQEDNGINPVVVTFEEDGYDLIWCPDSGDCFEVGNDDWWMPCPTLINATPAVE